MNQQQFQKVQTQDGFVAALDQSGGSTPKALKLYGVSEDQYSGETEMFDRIHEMRTRIISSNAFTGERVLAAILFKKTVEREVSGKPTAQFLWDEKQIVPFLKVDAGLAGEENGVQMMKPIPDFDSLLEFAKTKGIFGTKMRSVIKLANTSGIKAIVEQQFEIGKRILLADLVPIIEPEVDINSPEKEKAETLLKGEILKHLGELESHQKVMLKLTLPSQTDFYKELVEHPNVVRVVALSGGYSRSDANSYLSKNTGIIASFSRALTEGLSAQQSNEEFDKVLNESIQSIFDASKT